MSKLFRGGSPGRKQQQSSSEEGDAELEPILKEIRQSFIQDGQKWSVSQERKLVHLWRKCQRTSEEYKKAIEEVKVLKNQRKKDFDEMEKTIQSIKFLSQNKETLIQTLKSDNEKNAALVQQLRLEREAYLKGSQAIADLLVTEGMTEFDRANPQTYIEQLVKDKKKCAKEKLEMEDLYAEFQILKAQEMNDIKEQLKGKNTEIQQMNKELEKIKQENDAKSELLLARENTLTETSESIVKLKEEMKLEKSAYTLLVEELSCKYAAEKEKYEEKLKSLRNELTMEKIKVEESVDAKNAAISSLKISEASLSEALKNNEKAETESLELTASREVNNSLKKELNDKTQTLELKEEEVSNLQDKNHRQEVEMEKVKTALNEALAMNDVQRSQLANLEREKASLIEEMKNIGAEKVQFSKASEATSSQKERALQSMNQQVSELTSELESAHTNYRKQLEEIEAMKQKFQKMMEKEKETAYKQVVQLKDQVKIEKERNFSIQREIEGNDLKQLESRKKTESRINELLEELQRGKDENEKMRNSLIQETTKAITIQKEVDSEGVTLKKELEKRKMQLTENKEQTIVLEKKIEKVAKEKETIESQLLKQQHCFSRLGTHLKKATEQRLVSMDDQLVKLQGRFQHVNDSIQRQVSLVACWKKYSQDKDSVISELKEKLKNSLASKTLLDKQSDLLKANVTKLETSCSKLNDEITCLKKEKATLEQVSSEVKVVQTTSESIKSSTETSNQHLREEKKKMDQELKKLREQVKRQKCSEDKHHSEVQKVSIEKTVQLEAVQHENTELNKKINKIKSNNQNLSKRNSSLEAEMSSKQQMLTTLQKNVTEERNSLEAELQRLFLEKETIENKLKTEQKTNGDLNLELQKVTASLSILQMEADANNKDRGTTKTELETARSELLNVKQEMIKVEESLMTCQRNCGIKDQEAISLKRQLETLQTEQKSWQQLLQQVDEDKNNIESLTKQLLHKQKENNSHLEKITIAETTSKKLPLELAEKQNEIEIAKRNNEKLQSQLDNTRKILHSLEEEKRAIANKLKETQDKVEQANVTIRSSRRELADLQLAQVQKDEKFNELQEHLVSYKRQALTLEAEIETNKSRFVFVDEEMSFMKEKLETFGQELLMKETTLKSLEEEVYVLREGQLHLENVLKDKQVHIDILGNTNQQLKGKNARKKKKLVLSRHEEKLAKEKVTSLMAEVTALKLKCQETNYQLEEYQYKHVGQQSETEERLQMTKNRYQRKKWDMSSQMDKMNSELFSTKSKLDHEIQWRDHASTVHHQLVKDKRQLISQITDLEEKLREQTIKVIEQHAIIQRLEQENEMIERKFEQSLNSSLMDSYTTKRHAVSLMGFNNSYSGEGLRSHLKSSEPLSSLRMNRTH